MAGILQTVLVGVALLLVSVTYYAIDLINKRKQLDGLVRLLSNDKLCYFHSNMFAASTTYAKQIMGTSSYYS